MTQPLPIVAVDKRVRAVASFCALVAFTTAAAQEVRLGCDSALPVCGLGSERIVFGWGPAYPARAARNRIEGWVDLELRVDSAGNVIEVSALGSQPSGIFEETAIAAAKRWHFAPKEQAGDRVLTPRVIFELASP